MTDKKTRLFPLSPELEKLDIQYQAAEAVRASRAEAWAIASKASDKAWLSYCEASTVCDQLMDKMYELRLVVYAENTKTDKEE